MREPQASKANDSKRGDEASVWASVCHCVFVAINSAFSCMIPSDFAAIGSYRKALDSGLAAFFASVDTCGRFD